MNIEVITVSDESNHLFYKITFVIQNIGLFINNSIKFSLACIIMNKNFYRSES